MLYPAQFKLRLQLMLGALLDQPFKWLIATLSIAIGVGLGLAVHLIHQKALQQFDNGVRQFSGHADIRLVPHSERLPDDALDKMVGLDGVDVAAPVLELKTSIEGVDKAVRWMGIDVFTSGLITPNLIGQTDQEMMPSRSQAEHLASDLVFVSPALAELLRPGQSTLRTVTDGQFVEWRIAGLLPAVGAGQVMAVSDIAATQWKFNRLSDLARIDIKLQEGMSAQQFRRLHGKALEHIGRLETPQEEGNRSASVSKAYRANLSILAMVALLTGGFLSFSTQMLAVAQRARQWALLTSLGMTMRSLKTQVLFESAVCGVLGGVVGIGFGYMLAFAMVQTLGGDLGAGFFEELNTSLPLDLGDALVFVGFGLAATLVGGLVPANHTGELALYQRLRTGTEEAGLQFANRAHWLGLALLVLAAISVWIPPYGNIPLGGYLSIAFGLFGGVAMIGLVVRTLIRPPKRLRSLSGLARTRLASTPNLLSIGLSGIVASFALVVGMHIMVHSFRQSLDEWLNQVLPAPLYLDLKAPGQPSFPQSIQERISQIQGLEHVEFWGQQDLLLDPKRPAVSFISRPMVPSEANERLPLIGEFVGSPREGELPIWVSEPMVDLYNYKTGESVDLVLDGGRRIRATVMGVWRDYSRQHGAIVTSKIALKSLLNMQIADTQGAVWPEDNVTVAELTRRIASAARQADLQVPIDFSQPGDIRERSMAIFDRSFAVTYVLEFAAVLIGLFGVATTFSAMALQRKREFALLGALGAGPKAMRRMLTQEALLASLLAAAIGLLIGLAFAAVLIFVVNPQSFYWTMEWHTPWRDLTMMLFALVSLSTITVTLAPHAQLKDDLLNPLKEDWA